MRADIDKAGGHVKRDPRTVPAKHDPPDPAGTECTESWLAMTSLDRFLENHRCFINYFCCLRISGQRLLRELWCFSA